MSEPRPAPPAPRRVIADAVHDALTDLDVIARKPVAMHKIAAEYVLGYLDADGYTITRKDGDS